MKDKDGKIPAGLTTPTAGVPGRAQNGWQMTSAALVLFMTLPGLVLFYGGLVRAEERPLGRGAVLLHRRDGHHSVVDLRLQPGVSPRAAARLVDSGQLEVRLPQRRRFHARTPDYSYWVSHNVFAMYQLMFAIITPALILGAIAERMKFSAICLFMILWMLVVYFPQAHMVWGIDGMMNGVLQRQGAHQSHRFRGRHGGPHDLGMVGA